MIAEFPTFSPLQVGDRPHVQKLTKPYAPYSDFNFTSLYSWDTREAVRVSVLNGNLVVRFTDYTTGQPFYSFLGDHDTQDTTRRLLALAQSEGLEQQLLLVPEVSAQHGPLGAFEATQDDDNFDYILSVERLQNYHGNKLGPKRNFVNRFNREYESRTAIIDLADVGAQTRFLDMFHRWLVAKGERADNAENELLALHRVMFAARSIPELFTVATFVEGDLTGFSINEILGNGYAMIHFEKADPNYIGAYAHLMQQMAVLLGARGCQYINYEQDLGVFGLRRGKRSYVPTFFLRKFAVCATRSAAPEQTSELKSEQVLAAFVREGRPVLCADGAALGSRSALSGGLTEGVTLRASSPPRVAGQTVLPPMSAAPLELHPLSRSRTQAPPNAASPGATGSWAAAALPSNLGSLRPTPFDDDAWLPVASGHQEAPGRATRQVPPPAHSERRPSLPLIPREDPGAPPAPRVDWPTRSTRAG
jgi:hypothetical protein